MVRQQSTISGSVCPERFLAPAQCNPVSEEGSLRFAELMKAIVYAVLAPRRVGSW